MAKKHSTDPTLRELERELYSTTQALKEAYIRFDYVCDSELIDACIFEINALKARSNYLLRRIKEQNGQSVPSGIPHAVPVLKTEPSAPPCGLTLGVNWFNALTVGVLGLPGLGLLLLVKWVLV